MYKVGQNMTIFESS